MISEKRWRSLIYRKQEHLTLTLAQGLNQLLEKKTTMAGDESALHILFMRTSIGNARPYYRIYLMDQNNYHCSVDDWVYWDLSAARDFIEQALPFQTTGYGNDRQREVTTERQRIACAELLHQQLRKMIADILHRAAAQLHNPLSLPVYFGEYMQLQQLIFSPSAIPKGGTYAEY